jgi:hypothetical protein
MRGLESMLIVRRRGYYGRCARSAATFRFERDGHQQYRTPPDNIKRRVRHEAKAERHNGAGSLRTSMFVYLQCSKPNASTNQAQPPKQSRKTQRRRMTTSPALSTSSKTVTQRCVSSATTSSASAKKTANCAKKCCRW